jgi:hypothetical protein
VVASQAHPHVCAFALTLRNNSISVCLSDAKYSFPVGTHTTCVILGGEFLFSEQARTGSDRTSRISGTRGAPREVWQVETAAPGKVSVNCIYLLRTLTQHSACAGKDCSADKRLTCTSHDGMGRLGFL